MDIGTKLKSLRTQNGLTQQELADRAELTKGFIAQVERNFLQMTRRNRLSFGKKIIF